jgi:c-di-GMP-binding flagellar brake protein YcgR
MLNMQLLTGEKEQRYEVKLIGYLEDESILVTMPRVNGILAKIFVKDEYIVRAFKGKNIYAFKTHIIYINSIPFHYLHLRYPKVIENVEIRKAERAQVSLQARVVTQGKKSWGMIKDISSSGAMLMVYDEITHLQEHVELFFDVTVGGVERGIHLIAIARNMKKAEREDNKGILYLYGLEFIEPPQDAIVYVQAYVYEQLLKARDGT